MCVCVPIGIMLRVFANRSEKPEFNPMSCPTKDTKMVLDISLLNTQHYKVRISGTIQGKE